MAIADRGAIGRGGEQRALRHLQRQGLELIERNYRSRFGEIDIVMRDSECLVFIEVRVRSARDFASAAESVDARKRHKLALAAASFARHKRQWQNLPMRFDVVAIDRGRDGREMLEWIRDAFRPGD